jgi:phosphate transport system substrate-binding protein
MNPYMRSTSLAALSMVALAHPTVAGEVDPALPDYAPTNGLSASLGAMGSDTLNNLMTFWAEEFQTLQPQVSIEIWGKGGGTALGGLLNKADLGMASRLFTDKEVATFQDTFGYPPTAIAVAMDAVAMIVHPDNPLTHLTMAQVDAIFSSTRKRGGAAVGTWGDLGLKDAWGDLPLVPYGRNSASGTYGFFKLVALQRGDFAPTVREQPGSTAIVSAVTHERGAIGYVGVGYATGVRILPLVADAGEPIAPSADAIRASTYPLGRYLYLYLNQKPGTRNGPVRAFLTYVLSKAGQRIVVKDGYLPLDATSAAHQAKHLE